MNNLKLTSYLFGAQTILTIAGPQAEVEQFACRMYNVGAVSFRQEENEINPPSTQSSGLHSVTVATTDERLRKGFAYFVNHGEKHRERTKGMSRPKYLAYLDAYVERKMGEIEKVQPIGRRRILGTYAPASFDVEDPEKDNIMQDIFG